MSMLAESALDFLGAIEHITFLAGVIGVPKLFMMMLPISKASSHDAHNFPLDARHGILFLLILWIYGFETFWVSSFWWAVIGCIFGSCLFLALTFLLIWWLLSLLGRLFADIDTWCRRFCHLATSLVCCFFFVCIVIVIICIIVSWWLVFWELAINWLFLQAARLGGERCTTCTLLGVWKFISVVTFDISSTTLNLGCRLYLHADVTLRWIQLVLDFSSAWVFAQISVFLLRFVGYGLDFWLLDRERAIEWAISMHSSGRLLLLFRRG